MKSKLFALLIAALLCGNVGTAWAQSQGQPEGLPDLVVQVSWNPADGWVNVRVTNIGTGFAGGFYSFLYIDPSQQPPQLGTPDTSRSYLFGLAPGASYTWGYGPWNPTPGQHTLWAWVDRDNAVIEEDDFNNFGFFLVGDATPTPTETATPAPTATPGPKIYCPLMMSGYIGMVIIPGEPTPTPTATTTVYVTPDSRAMVTTTPTATSVPQGGYDGQ